MGIAGDLKKGEFSGIKKGGFQADVKVKKGEFLDSKNGGFRASKKDEFLGTQKMCLCQIL